MALDKILIIDDDVSLGGLIQGILETKIKDIELSIDIANSPEKAEEYLKENEYKLIISDNNMPEKLGLEILADARNGNYTKNMKTPFIIVSGKYGDQTGLPEKGGNISGFTDAYFIPKPFRIDEFLPKVNEYLRK
ncbi:MAG: response regulator [Nanoarchaeota archaeon]|nr:response regulator [Nanoarchaeota archaeon]